MGKMVSLPFLGCFFIRSFLYLQVTRTCLKSWMSSNFGQIGLLTTELVALERLKISHRLIIEKWCFHTGLFFFDWIIIKVAGNQDRHESLVEFNFGPNQMTNFGVTCPWVTKISHFWTWMSPKPVGQSWSNFMCSIIGVAERLHKVLGRLALAHWTQVSDRCPLCYLFCIIWAAWQNQQYELCAQWRLRAVFAVAKDPRFLRADSKDSDQNGCMARLIWVFAGGIGQFVGFVVLRLSFNTYTMWLWKHFTVSLWVLE